VARLALHPRQDAKEEITLIKNDSSLADLYKRLSNCENKGAEEEWRKVVGQWVNEKG
jgi:hypothetical protein